MANLPKADELIGSTVTQQQFKTKLKQLVENIDRSYATLAEANADIANIGVGAKVDTDDSGRYYKATAGATSLTKSPYDPLTQAKEYTNDVALSVSEQTSAEFHNADKDNTSTPLMVFNDVILLSINSNGEIQNAEPKSIDFEFHNTDDSIKSEYIETDENGFVVQTENKSDVDLDTSKMQLNEKDLETGAIYKSNDLLKVARDHTSDFYNLEVTNSTFSTYSAIYAIIDSWMNQYPDYISKSLAGNDDWNNPIYKYEFLSPRFVDDGSATVITDERTTPPRIFLSSGTHGVEREAVLSNIILMNDVVNNWRECDELTQLRWATDIIFVPIVNPSGYNANTRENKNNVDLNRDGIAKTQTETNLFLSVLDSYTDIDIAFDHHNSYTWDEHDRPFWISFTDGNSDIVSFCKNVCYKASSYLRKEFDLKTSGNIPTSKMGISVAESLATANETKHGVTSILVETPRQGSTGTISLKNRRIHNMNCIKLAIVEAREYIINQQLEGAAQ
ncbi:DUF2817 domain-containing protein [Acinetobacter sp. NIPH 2377]|uniref:DUF2817 domain-containing protein n=1 Tax=Acinetobacter terrestris TaxID=2529843 RepID=UPI0014905201|nr:DUF2817 domain-containing protein [Acinetobacter terrestris]NNH35723.1 DUF2817 domain-containing protein [Acinetobacter terrestris]